MEKNMDFKFWRKKETAAPSTGEKAQKKDKPRDLPQDVYRYLVTKQGLDPDWVWKLKHVRKRRENPPSTFDIRIFDPETAALQGAKVSDYASLDDHMGLVIFAGWYDKEISSVELERLIEEAV
jgi:hypothetical protein